MDAAKWSQANHQEIGLMKPMEEIVTSCNSSGTCTAAARPGAVAMERKARPPEQLNCPRCNSTNTKFCYYNNYSLTQPRYFCKTCRRYWTEGGSLRNVPVGGGSRKNKRSSSSFSSPQQQAAAAAANSSHHHPPPKVIPDLNPPNNINNLSVHFSSSHQSPVADRIQKGQDLNLAFPAMQETHQAMSHHFLQITPKMENSNNATSAHHHHHQQQQQHQENNSSSSPAHQSLPYDHHPSQLSALELLRTGMATRGLNSFLPGQVIDSNALYNSTGFSMHDYKPNLGFTIENGLGNRADNNNGGGGGGGGRITFFPFGEMKQINSGTSDGVEHHQGNKGQQGNSSAGEYWSNNGVLGGGPW